ncbi:MAG: diaminopropionate ammonia-lyase, partial [Egibacteraceae bacterium]
VMQAGAVTTARIHLPASRGPAPANTRAAGPPRAFHRTMPSYSQTSVVPLPDLAAELGIGELWMKDESERIGLPSFKILGGAWAVHRLLLQRVGEPFAGRGFDELRRVAARLAPLTLCTATDGNHGRGLARMARLLGLDAVVFVPDNTVQVRIAAIESEQATVVISPGDYDAAVARAAAEAGEHGWQVVADVAYEGYTHVPAWVMDGYDTIFDECGEQLPEAPTTVFVQAGVGALAGAAVGHYTALGQGTRFAIVEPLQAACLLESARRGEPIALASSQGSIMAGLNCGTPSTVAWPRVFAHADAYVAIPDERTRQAMRVLAAHDVEAGESGAAGLAGLLEVAADPDAREALGLDGRARVLVVNTEGATDPEAYRRILGGR